MYCTRCGDIIEPGEKFCNKCGMPIKRPPSNIDKVKSLIIGGIIGGVFSLVFILIISNSEKKYYFNTKDNNTTTVMDKSGSYKGKYSTVIVYDNVYSGMNIKNRNEALNLIIKDSTTQKDKCPKNIQKVENDIIKNYGITAVNLCEMNVEFAKELENVFKKIYNEYPSVKGYITNLTLVNAPLSDDYIAAFMPAFTFATSNTSSTYPWVIKTQILLNTSYFLNVDRLKASTLNGSNVGHFPKNSTIYSPLAHELGHYLSFLVMMKHYNLTSILLLDSSNMYSIYELYDDFDKGNYSLTLINEAYQKYRKDTKSTISLDEWRGTISQYALAKDNSGNYIYDETIAEAFHDVYLNGNQASEASKYISSLLKEKLES